MSACDSFSWKRSDFIEAVGVLLSDARSSNDGDEDEDDGGSASLDMTAARRSTPDGRRLIEFRTLLTRCSISFIGRDQMLDVQTGQGQILRRGESNKVQRECSQAQRDELANFGGIDF